MELQIIETLVLVIHVGAALAIIGLVLIQQGRGADMGSGFGGGSSNTVFGSGGSGSFLTRMTTTIAVAFFLTSFGLAFFAKQHSLEAQEVGMPKMPQQEQAAPAPEPAGSELPGEPAPPEGAGESEIPADLQ